MAYWILVVQCPAQVLDFLSDFIPFVHLLKVISASPKCAILGTRVQGDDGYGCSGTDVNKLLFHVHCVWDAFCSFNFSKIRVWNFPVPLSHILQSHLNLPTNSDRDLALVWLFDFEVYLLSLITSGMVGFNRYFAAKSPWCIFWTYDFLTLFSLNKPRLNLPCGWEVNR